MRANKNLNVSICFMNILLTGPGERIAFALPLFGLGRRPPRGARKRSGEGFVLQVSTTTIFFCFSSQTIHVIMIDYVVI